MSLQRDSGLAALQRGDFNSAVSLLEEACRIKPDDYDAFQYLAAAYQQVGRTNDACHVQVSAVNLQPANAQARYNLGVVMERAGYVDEARQAYQQALQLRPDYAQAGQALARLGAGSPAPGPAAAPAGSSYGTGGQPPLGTAPSPGSASSLQQPSSPYQPSPTAYPPPSAAPYQQPGAPNHQQPTPYQHLAGYQQPSVPYQQSPSAYQPPAPYQQPQTGYQQPAAYPPQSLAAPYAPTAGQSYPPNAVAPAYNASPYGVQQARGVPVQGAGCAVCGVIGPTRDVRYSQNIGLLVMRLSKRIGGPMCDGCATKRFWEYTLTTLLLGWFGVISFFVTPFIIVGNVISFAKGASAGQRVLSISLLLVMLVPIALVIWLIATSKPSGPSE